VFLHPWQNCVTILGPCRRKEALEFEAYFTDFASEYLFLLFWGLETNYSFGHDVSLSNTYDRTSFNEMLIEYIDFTTAKREVLAEYLQPS
jgi:hypothetical protein